ncbi:MAG: hypothetical protein C5B51_07150 [Terriglobia bacterium]|nr:MAG: hypothetical protein C5B51_07150 [Terriglobia bacterium]
MRGLRSFWPFAIAVCGLIATLLFADALVKRDLTQLQSRTQAESRHVAAQVRAGILQEFEPLRRMAAWWLLQGRPLTPDDWQSDAQLFVSERAGLEKLTWINANGKPAWSVRPNLAADPDAMETPDADLEAAFKAARQLNSLTVSRVFETEGKLHVYACTPVFREGRLAGFIAGLFNAAELVTAVVEGQLPDDYSITVSANGRQIPVKPHRASAKWAGFARETRISLGNSFWTVQVMPSGNEVATLRRLAVSFGVLVSILLYACVAMALVAKRKATELAGANQRLLVENQERRRAEERIGELNRDLERRLHEFRVLLEVLPIGIAVAEDPECRRIWANQSMADMLHVGVSQNISKSAEHSGELPYKFLNKGEEVPPDELPIQRAARTRQPVSGQELDIVRKDGSVLHTLSFAAPVLENGVVREVIDACVDITERKRAEEERRLFLDRRRELEQRVERAEKYRSLALMAGGIAHDFNNLLTVIIGHANFLALDFPPSSRLGHSVASMLASANRASELTSKLVAFTGHIWCDVQPLDISAEVSSMEESLRRKIPPAAVLQLDLAASLPRIYAGVSELQQVLHSLVENAAEALDGHPGKIEIRTSQCELSPNDLEILYPDQQLAPGRYVRLEVTDNGCGIPEEILTRIFDPFFTTKFVGRGLGLSAVQGIVRAHNGAIRVESTLHYGARVEIVLPVDLDEMTQLPSPAIFAERASL